MIVSPTPTHPPVSGNRARICAFISCLKALGCNIHFLHLEREKGDRNEMQNAWGDSYQFAAYQQPNRTLIQKFIRKIKILFNSSERFQYSIDEWWDDSNDELLKSLQEKYKFDVVMVEYVFFSKALSCFPSNVLKIIDTHDVFSNRYKKFLKKNMKPVWYSTTQKEESKALDRADVVVAIQDEERKFFKKITQTSVITVGHLVELVRPDSPGGSFKILYVASKNTNNLKSIEWFINEPLVKIRKILPEAELNIAGTICDNLPDVAGVIKLGVVDDLADIYKQANVVINPMFNGTGLKIKNVEALGYSKPLVTSSVGAEGLEDGAGKAYLLANDSEQFVSAVVKVLSDEAVSKELAVQAYNYATSWNSEVMKSLEHILNK